MKGKTKMETNNLELKEENLGRVTEIYWEFSINYLVLLTLSFLDLFKYLALISYPKYTLK